MGWQLERRFIGRQAELDTLRAALERAAAGEPGIVLLAGEPGIGKTRTAQEIFDHATQRATLALWGRCPEEPGAPPSWPWLQVLRRYVALHTRRSSPRSSVRLRLRSRRWMRSWRTGWATANRH